MTEDTGHIVESYRALLDEIDEGFCVIEMIEGGNGEQIDYRFLETNASFERQTGLINAVGRRMRDLEPHHEQHWFDRYSRIARTRVPERFEDRADALGRWYDVYAFPLGPPEQRRVAILFRDVIDRKRAEEALRDSEERLRRVLETDAVGIVFFNYDGVVLDANDAFIGMTGYTRAQVEAGSLTWRNMTPPEWIAESEAQIARSSQTGRVGPYEKECFLADGSRAWMHFAGRDIGNGTIVEYCINIDDQKRAIERQGILLAELQHRVRNILAMFRSIVRQTSRNKAGLEDFVGLLTGRIDAMARTQTILTRHAGAWVDLEEILRDELLAQAAESSHLSVAGPTVRLSPKAAEVLTLGFHELATNSVKYGVLGNGKDGGRIAVEWTSNRIEGRDWLALRWSETGIETSGAKVSPGFGTELITRRIPYELGGKASMEFANDSLVIEITFALTDGASVFETGANRSGEAIL